MRCSSRRMSASKSARLRRTERGVAAQAERRAHDEDEGEGELAGESHEVAGRMQDAYALSKVPVRTLTRPGPPRIAPMGQTPLDGPRGPRRHPRATSSHEPVAASCGAGTGADQRSGSAPSRQAPSATWNRRSRWAPAKAESSGLVPEHLGLAGQRQAPRRRRNRRRAPRRSGRAPGLPSVLNAKLPVKSGEVRTVWPSSSVTRTKPGLRAPMADTSAPRSLPPPRAAGAAVAMKNVSARRISAAAPADSAGPSACAGGAAAASGALDELGLSRLDVPRAVAEALPDLDHEASLVGRR